LSQGIVYLIHFEQPVGDPKNPRGQARHYLGWALDLDVRLAAHASGNGSRLMQVVGELGIRWRVVRTWEGSRELERQLKRQHNSPRLCPICNPKP
jgi:predicted GIY-YIG superfamily endonuclease